MKGGGVGVGAYSRWALIRGWALIRYGTCKEACKLPTLNYEGNGYKLLAQRYFWDERYLWLVKPYAAEPPATWLRHGYRPVLPAIPFPCENRSRRQHTEAMSVFTAGMPEKLIRVRLRRHAGVKNLRCFLSRRRYVFICQRSIGASTSQVARRHMRTRVNPNNPRNQCPAKLISILAMSFWKGELSTILMTLFLDEMQDSDSERKQERIKTRREEEKKENDMIIFQEMITIPNQEEIDELVGGRSTCRFVIPRCK